MLLKNAGPPHSFPQDSAGITAERLEGVKAREGLVRLRTIGRSCQSRCFEDFRGQTA